MIKCENCNGTGSVRFHNKGGVCFDCNGNGRVKGIKRAEPTLREIVMSHRPFLDLFTFEELAENIKWGEAQIASGKSVNSVLSAFNFSMDRRAELRSGRMS